MRLITFAREGAIAKKALITVVKGAHSIMIKINWDRRTNDLP